eukprot:ANDGO_07793.mRNA.1 Receptor-like protein kinase 2
MMTMLENGDDACCSGQLYGVVCSGSRVTKLLLGSNMLSGTIPASICDLSMLTLLDLSANAVNGSIPSCIGQLSQLVEIDFYFNSIGGSIPDSIVQLRALQTLNVHSNRISGPIPDGIGYLSALQMLLINANQISGSLPRSLCWLQNLTRIDADENAISGPIPACIGNLSTLLYSIDLSSNQLSGEIPYSLCSLSVLTTLRLFGNMLRGELPDCIGNLTAVNSFVVYSNQLSGRFPLSMRNLSQLELLDVHLNNFEGPVPGFIFTALPRLQTADLHLNRFSGSLVIDESAISALPAASSLKALYLQYNNVSGDLPASLCLLQRLQLVFLSNNQISAFPKCAFPNLVVLDLSSNRLVDFPFSLIESFPSLQSLDLSYNLLNGSYPVRPFMGNLSLRSLSLAYNQYSGDFPFYPCGYYNPITNVSYPTVSESGLSDLDISGNRVDSIPGVINAFSECILCDSLPYASLTTLKIENMMLQSVYDVLITLTNGDTCGGSVPFSQMLFLFPGVRALDVSSNGFSNLLDGFIAFLPLLSSLDFRNNPRVEISTSFSSSVGSLFVLNATTAYPYSVSLMCYLPNIGGSRLLAQVDPTFFSYKNCVCRPGFFGKPPDCHPCLQNGICSFSSEDVITQLNPATAWNLSGSIIAADGYYASPDVSISDMQHDISYPRFLESCAYAGTDLTPCKPSSSGADSCVEGYEGRLCSACSDGYFRSGDLCEACPDFAELVLFGMLVFFVVCCLFAWSFVVDNASSGLVKVFVFFWQAVFYIRSPMPKTMYIFTQETSSSVSFTLAGPECFFGSWGFVDRYVLSVVSPAIAVAVVFLIWAAGALKMKMSEGAGRPAPASQWTAWIDRCWRSVIFWIMLLLMPAFSTVLAPLSCVKDEGDHKEYLVYYPFEECSVNLQIASSFLLLLYGVVTPCCLSYLLWKSGALSERVQVDPRKLLVYSMLFGSYRRKCRWWEIMVTARRMLFVAFFVTIPPLSEYRSLTVSMLLVLSCCVQAITCPYHNDQENYAEISALSLLIVNLVCSIQSQVIHVSDVNGAGVFIFVLNMLFSVVVLSMIAMQFRRKFLLKRSESYRSSPGFLSVESDLSLTSSLVPESTDRAL